MTPSEALEAFRRAASEIRTRLHQRHTFDGPNWAAYERFQELEASTFDDLVARPLGLAAGQYGGPLPVRGLSLRPAEPNTSAMINRAPGTISGYWDHPVRTLPNSTILEFLSFFEWDQLAVHDYSLVLVTVARSPDAPEIEGHSAIVKFSSVSWERAA